MRKVSWAGVLGTTAMTTAMATAMTLSSFNASALEVAYSPWYTQVKGNVSNQGREVSLRDELNLDNSASQGWLVAEGNWLRLTYTPIDYSENGKVSSSTNFGGSTYQSNTNLRTEADLTDMGARFLWQPFDETNFGIGVTVKVLDGDIQVTNLDQEEDAGPGIGSIPVLGGLLGGEQPKRVEKRTFSEVFPLLSVNYRMPITDFLTVGGEASYVTYDGNEVLEMGLDLEVRGEAVGLRLGWHEKRYDVTDDDFSLDARFKGIFGQLSFYL